MLVSLCYLVLRWLLQLIIFRVRSHEWKELEIVVLRVECVNSICVEYGCPYH